MSKELDQPETRRFLHPIRILKDIRESKGMTLQAYDRRMSTVPLDVKKFRWTG